MALRNSVVSYSKLSILAVRLYVALVAVISVLIKSFLVCIAIVCVK